MALPNPFGHQRYWVRGRPFTGVQLSTHNPGSQQYWVAGQPVGDLFGTVEEPTRASQIPPSPGVPKSTENGLWWVSGRLLPVLSTGNVAPREQRYWRNGRTVVDLYQEGAGRITGIVPSTGERGAVSLSVALTGLFTHWVNGVTVASFSGAGITVNSTTVIDGTHASVNITIAGGAAVGARNVTMTTGAEVVTALNGFIVAVAGGAGIIPFMISP